jgi:hypothetical protein
MENFAEIADFADSKNLDLKELLKTCMITVIAASIIPGKPGQETIPGKDVTLIYTVEEIEFLKTAAAQD